MRLYKEKLSFLVNNTNLGLDNYLPFRETLLQMNFRRNSEQSGKKCVKEKLSMIETEKLRRFPFSIRKYC